MADIKQASALHKLQQANVATNNNQHYEQAWQAHAPTVAWGTLLLALSIMLGYIAIGYLLSQQHITYWTATAICTWLCYASFTVMHDAGHGSIFSAHHHCKKLESSLGWLASLPLLMMPYRSFQRLHDRHHSFTNHPKEDPEHFIWHNSVLQVLANTYLIPLQYWHILFRQCSADSPVGTTRRSALIYQCVVLISLATLAWTSGIAVLFHVAILPMLFTVFLLVMFFDYLPHSFPAFLPKILAYTSRISSKEQTDYLKNNSSDQEASMGMKRFSNTRIVPGRWLNILLLGQNYHLVHHLYPRVPWYNYRHLFHDIQPYLVQQNSPIGIASFIRDHTQTQANKVESPATVSKHSINRITRHKSAAVQTSTKNPLTKTEPAKAAPTKTNPISFQIENQPPITLELNNHQTLLNAAIRNEIRIPNACRRGMCGSCKVKIVAGQSRHLNSSAKNNREAPPLVGISDIEIQHGYRLACQCIASTE